MEPRIGVQSEELFEKSNYRNAVNTLASLAHGVGVEISPHTKSNWEMFMYAMRHIDSYIDESPNLSTSQERMGEVLDFMHGKRENLGEEDSELNTISHKLKSIISTLPPKNQNLIARETKNIFDLEMDIRLTHDPKEFATARRVIGQKTSRLLLTLIENEAQREKVDRIFKLIGRFGNDVDTLADWSRDFQRSEHQFPPTFTNLVPTISSSIIDLALILKQHSHTIIRNIPELLSSTIKTITGEKRKAY